jgi:hypothetical protein
MRAPLVLCLSSCLLSTGCQPPEGDFSSEEDVDEADDTSVNGFEDDTGQGLDTGLEAELDVGVLSTGNYLLNTTEDDWATDTCGVSGHQISEYEIWVDVVGSYLTILHDWSTNEAGIQEDGSFTMQSGMSTTVDYSDDCVVTITAQGLGQIVRDDYFELTIITNRTGQGDCAVALTDLDALPCEEIRTWHLSR